MQSRCKQAIKQSAKQSAKQPSESPHPLYVDLNQVLMEIRNQRFYENYLYATSHRLKMQLIQIKKFSPYQLLRMVYDSTLKLNSSLICH